ncbi:ferritin-like domain-containing protein [Sulfuriflexus mobilis]|uniref:ferritin-like domain-containing protein n=1 Tax=Sulfuriflexus mobilis TaxID=1811807 RepID=UPI000F81EC80|nr:ferritin-like domain-containing protein [Sulfuriflexus mobilis]
MPNLFDVASQCLAAQDPNEKCELTNVASSAWQAGELDCVSLESPLPIGEPGRPPRPELVTPRELNSRKLGSGAGHASLIHAIAHIEFNAINLAWDAVYRFRDMPEPFYADWIRVAREEAYHFCLLRTHLQELGYDYGDFVAHNGLWEMAQKTAHDGLIRMALVPRVLEARGLDVTPGMIKRLEGMGDHRAVEILDIILREEVGHVEIGTRWFRYFCTQRGLDSEKTFKALLDEYMQGSVRGPFYYAARLQAGFTESEMQMLEQSAKRR